MPGGNYKTKKLIFISVAMFLAAIFASIPLATNGEHCPAHSKDNVEGISRKDALCLENQYPKIPLPKMGNTSLFDKGPYSLNDIAEKVKTPFNTVDPLSGLIYYLFTFSVSVVGIIAFGAIIYAGVMLMMSGARPQLRMDAKNKIRNVILGIALLLGSVILLNTINPELSIINVPGADKGSGLKFDLPPQIKLLKRGAVSDAELAKLMCPQNSRRTKAPSIQEIKLTARGMNTEFYSEYSTDDFKVVQDIIIDDPALCGSGEAPGSEVEIIDPESGETKTVTVRESTVPKNFCSKVPGAAALSGAAFRKSGTVGTKAEMGALTLGICSSGTEEQKTNIISALRGNVDAILTFCSANDRSYCFLQDLESTSVSDVPASAFVDYCKNLLGC